jgi:hypothetical protein
MSTWRGAWLVKTREIALSILTIIAPFVSLEKRRILPSATTYNKKAELSSKLQQQIWLSHPRDDTKRERGKYIILSWAETTWIHNGKHVQPSLLKKKEDAYCDPIDTESSIRIYRVTSLPLPRDNKERPSRIWIAAKRTTRLSLAHQHMQTS